MAFLSVFGAKVHNLKNIDVKIPRHAFTVITGVSGSGKSSLAFDTIYEEGKSKYLESLSSSSQYFFEFSRTASCDRIEGLSPTIAIGQEGIRQGPRSTVGTITGIYDYLRLFYAAIGKPHCACGALMRKEKRERIIEKKGLWRSELKKIRENVLACPQCKSIREAVHVGNFSFNAPQGACPSCGGIGTKSEIDAELLIPNKKLSIAEGGVRPWSRFFAPLATTLQKLEQAGGTYGFNLRMPLQEFSSDQWKILLYGTSPEEYPGIIPLLEQKLAGQLSLYLREEIEKYLCIHICPSCRGKRLRKESLRVTIDGKNISDLAELSFEKLEEALRHLQLSVSEKKVLAHVLPPLTKKLRSALDAGIGYLTINRGSETLAGGETQRLRLINQLESELTEVIYIFDEPTIGLHPRDTAKLIRTLQALRDKGNTVIVVEHDPEVMKAADHIITLGPGAGVHGGKIIPSLKNISHIARPKQYRNGSKKFLEIRGAEEFNLKNIDVKIPLGMLVCVTGVSGSGKSTLMSEILAKALLHRLYRAKDLPGKHEAIHGIENIDKFIFIDQSPIGRTPRSNPATYTGIFTLIRDIFTELPEAKQHRMSAGHFSFNVKDGGRCEVCEGEGYQKVSLHFLPDMYLECDSCKGKRYNEKSLSIFYKGKNIADVLDMSVEESCRFFGDKPLLKDKLQVLADVGLGYMKLGQSATTVSGGEAQRIKLATELSRRDTGKTVYLLDEPTTGLHIFDTEKLLHVLQKLVDKGNTVVVIEHSLEVIQCADWVIDLGPEGGDEGGYLVAEGRPTDIVKNTKSYTGQYLAKILAKQ